MPLFGCNISALVEHAEQLKQVRKANLQSGDRVLVKTLNSVYSIRVIEKGKYVVTGGWFDRKGLSPMKTTINGCTWGGSVIKIDIVAACGLCLEFGNRLVTSPIQTVVFMPRGGEN